MALSLSALLLLATTTAAQTTQNSSPSNAAALIDEFGQWEPLGPIPVDQAGAGRRGYVLPAETAEVAQPGADEISVHTVASNNFYREETSDFLISERYETHTLALGYRRGFKVDGLPRFELGG